MLLQQATWARSVHQSSTQYLPSCAASVVLLVGISLARKPGARLGLLHGQVQLSVLDDGTLAIEANIHELLAQWPYLSDLSLIWSVASIFQPQTLDKQADPAHNDAALAASKLLQGAELQPWLYLNLIAHNSHMFIPILDLVRVMNCSSTFSASHTPVWYDEVSCICYYNCGWASVISGTHPYAVKCLPAFCSGCQTMQCGVHLVLCSLQGTAGNTALVTAAML